MQKKPNSQNLSNQSFKVSKVTPYLEPPTQLLVEKKPRKLSSAGPLQELHKDFPHRPLNLVSSLLEFLVPYEMGLVVISLEFLEKGLKLRLAQVLVDFSVEKGLHFIKVRCIESWGEKGLFDGSFCSFLGLCRSSC